MPKRYCLLKLFHSLKWKTKGAGRTWQEIKRDENNGDGDFGDGVKRYKPRGCWERCGPLPGWGVHTEAETLIQWELIS